MGEQSRLSTWPDVSVLRDSWWKHRILFQTENPVPPHRNEPAPSPMRFILRDVGAERTADTKADVSVTDGRTATSYVKTPPACLHHILFQAFYADSLNVFLRRDDIKIPFVQTQRVDRCFCYLNLSRLVGYLPWSSELRILKISLPPSQSIYCRLGRDVVKSGRWEPTYLLHCVTYRETDVVLVTATRTQNLI
jgi:hypothetical protein